MRKKTPKTKKIKKDMLISDLAVMVQKSFIELHKDMDKRFSQVDKRFIDLEDRMERRFSEVDRRFDIIENKFIANHTKELDHLRDRMLRIEARLAKIT